MLNCLVENNLNEGIKGDKFHVDNCTIRGNGGVGISGDSYGFHIRNCEVKNNNGGIRGSVGKFVLINCLITNNALFGVYSMSCGFDIYNCTVINNEDGGITGYEDVQQMPTEPYVFNTIIWGNSGIQVKYFYTGGTNLYHCFIQNGWTFSGSNNSDNYPEFSDTVNADWSLKNYSPCINEEQMTLALLSWKLTLQVIPEFMMEYMTLLILGPMNFRVIIHAQYYT